MIDLSRIQVPSGKLVVSYGGGVNSVAQLVLPRGLVEDVESLPGIGVVVALRVRAEAQARRRELAADLVGDVLGDRETAYG